MSKRRDRREMFKEKVDEARRRNEMRKQNEEVRLCTAEAVDSYIKTAYARRDLPILFVAPPVEDATERVSRVTSQFGFETFRRMDSSERVTEMRRFVDDILAGHRGLVGLFNAADIEALVIRLESDMFKVNRAQILSMRVIVMLDEEYSITQVIETVAINRETGELVLNWPFINLGHADVGLEVSDPKVYKSSKSVIFGVNLGEDERFAIKKEPDYMGKKEGAGGDKGGGEQ